MNRIPAWIALWVSAALACAEEESPLHKRVAVKYDNLPVVEVLKDLADKAGVRFALDEKLLETADRVTCEAAEVEAGRIATRLLLPRGLKLENAGGAAVSVVKRDPFDEFKVKREESFEFAEKPAVTREGDKVTISFASKGWCDATVAIEDMNGRIIRHLACGVLGENAPEPFQWNSKKQTLLWDGKDDKHEYVDNKDSVIVRVSLGLKPGYERSLYWEPKRRVSTLAPLLAAAEEGVYVLDSNGLDHLRLFDHKGDYVRTIYPFPADKMKDVKGMEMVKFPQMDEPVPLKRSSFRTTLLSSGDQGSHYLNGLRDYKKGESVGTAASAMAVRNGRIALVKFFLNRLSTDGSSGGLPLYGPRTGYNTKIRWTPQALTSGRMVDVKTLTIEAEPIGAALSPDGQWLYLTGYLLSGSVPGLGVTEYRHGVLRMRYDGDAEPQIFLGEMEKPGNDDTHFNTPISVDCDDQGRVYVADLLNDRVQVFSSEGKLLKTIPARKPVFVRVHRKSQGLYVGSWAAPMETAKKSDQADAALTQFGTFDNPKVIARYEVRGIPGYAKGSDLYQPEMDSWAHPFALWITKGHWLYENIPGLEHLMLNAALNHDVEWKDAFLRLMVPEGDRLTVKRDLVEDARKTIDRLKPATHNSQMIFANPKTGHVFLGERRGKLPSAVGVRVEELIELDPETGKHRLIKPPFLTSDVAFDSDGAAYLLGDDEMIVRYDLETMREIPWDYGEAGKAALSGLKINSKSFGTGAFCVSADGHIAALAGSAGAPVYPGRPGGGQELAVWNKHGKVVYRDAVPGFGMMAGMGLDKDLNLTLGVWARHVMEGKPYFMSSTGTLMKFKPRKGRFLSPGNVPVPLPVGDQPKRPVDLNFGYYSALWVQGAEWMHGGIGFLADGAATTGGAACPCYHSRCDFDYFGRSFAPVPDIFRVEVLDGNGNLILRVGQYGNEDSDGPKSLVPLGGDGVGLFSPHYVATHTDRRLFIADQGNARIVSVKLGYHTDAKVALKDVPDDRK